ncbi:MAG TPA: GNAT family N-acetyltransferase [Candidatus Alistipes merdigallinarum]|nr:GNAT family N-acetyltransferase [Candidatus Alistipes merdigallinarum]
MAHIRFATESDIPLIYGFILKMARYEKLENEVDTSEEALHRAIFLEKQAEVILCEAEGKTVGFALFFHNFSTFKGQHGLYLEDIYVDQEYRGRGYGKALFLKLVAIAMERRCRRMEWTALNWNRPAIAFYESLGAVRMNEWSTFRLDEEHLRILNAAQQTH